MEDFPFTADEWSTVSEAGRAIVNAAFAEDAFLHASLLEDLRCVLCELRGKYGQHPVLLETEGDFTDDLSQRVTLYEQAIQVAQIGGLATYSIRISLARVLLEELEDAGRAMEELSACGDEITACGDRSAPA